MPVHRTSLRVRFNELDPYSHVNHAVYVTWFEVGRTEALAAAGIPIHVMAERGWHFVVSELRLRYRAPAVAGDDVVVETAVVEVGASVTRWQQRVLRGETVLVESDLRAATTDASGRLRRMPAELVSELTPLLADAVSPAVLRDPTVLRSPTVLRERT